MQKRILELPPHVAQELFPRAQLISTAQACLPQAINNILPPGLRSSHIRRLNITRSVKSWFDESAVLAPDPVSVAEALVLGNAQLDCGGIRHLKQEELVPIIGAEALALAAQALTKQENGLQETTHDSIRTSRER